MGRLSGHLLPGFFFIYFGLWWSYNIFYRYYVSRKEAVINCRGRKNMKFRSSLLFPCNGCCKQAPVEAILIVVATTIGFIGELVTAFKHGEFANVGNSQHMSMYFFYGLMAFVNILLHYKFSIPSGTDYAVALLALVNEGLLFANHLHGRPPLDVLVHTLLLYLIYGTLICGALEIKYRREVLPAIGRAYFTIVQGTWFCHVGFILYPLPGMSTWDLENHSQMTVATTLFTVHLAATLVFLMVFGFLINFRVRLMNKTTVQRIVNSLNSGADGMVMNNTYANGELNRAIISESEEEV